MQAEIAKGADYVEVRLAGALTFDDHEPFRQLLSDLLAAESPHVVLELSSVTSVDSSGLGMFLIADDETKRAGRRLTLRSAEGQVRHVLKLSGVDTIIAVE